MNKLLFRSLFIFFAVFALSCSKSDDNTSVTSNTSIVGTYTTEENGQPMQFVLNADGTGHENYQGDIRPFTWKLKDGKVLFTYNGETIEWELPINTEKGEITYGSLVYKKE